MFLRFEEYGLQGLRENLSCMRARLYRLLKSRFSFRVRPLGRTLKFLHFAAETLRENTGFKNYPTEGFVSGHGSSDTEGFVSRHGLSHTEGFVFRHGSSYAEDESDPHGLLSPP